MWLIEVHTVFSSQSQGKSLKKLLIKIIGIECTGIGNISYQPYRDYNTLSRQIFLFLSFFWFSSLFYKYNISIVSISKSLKKMFSWFFSSFGCLFSFLELNSKPIFGYVVLNAPSSSCMGIFEQWTTSVLSFEKKSYILLLFHNKFQYYLAIILVKRTLDSPLVIIILYDNDDLTKLLLFLEIT